MKKGIAITSVLLVALFVGKVSAAAEPSRFDFGLGVNAAVGYDSNVGIQELDQNTGEADSVRELGVAVSGRFRASDRLTLRAGYDYTDTAYSEFSEFDLGLHHVVAEAAYRHRIAEAGLSLQRYDGILDGEPYLRVTHVSPSLSKLFADSVYVRAAYVSARKDYDGQEGRDATGKGFRIDTYLLQDGMRRYVALTLQSNDETATSREFDYQGRQAAITLGRRFETSLMTMDLKMRLRYEKRDYAHSADFLETRREDKRTALSVDASIPMSDHVSLQGSLQGTDNRSTYAPAQSREVVAMIGLKLGF